MIYQIKTMTNIFFSNYKLFDLHFKKWMEILFSLKNQYMYVIK